VKVRERWPGGPILFSGSMVKAILDGRKTQTRRVVKRPKLFGGGAYLADRWTLFPHPGGGFMSIDIADASEEDFHAIDDRGFPCPYGEPGDLLWVRETWSVHHAFDADAPRDLAGSEVVRYSAGGEGWEQARVRASIHMPRWASRLTLRVTDVRVERICDITPTDALAEGCGRRPCASCNEGGCDDCLGEGWISEVDVFRELWDSINGKRTPWESNPWVWCISFERVEAP
jgi:hypothetical protein